MNRQQIFGYAYRATVAYLVMNIALWFAFFTFDFVKRLLAEDSVRGAFFKLLFVTSVLSAFVSFASSAVMWQSSQDSRRLLFVATAGIYIALCYFNLIARMFCEG